MTTFNPHFLVISLGNSGQYYETLHSAGHFALKSLQKAIAGRGYSELSQPPFVPQRRNRKACQASSGSKYTLLQSPTLMNVSGPWVAGAWAEALKQNGLKPKELSMVIVHDELEQAFGAVKTRGWGMSHRGHNGIKSLQAVMNKNNWPGARWSRISIGIDRPVSRGHQDVANYVLSPLSGRRKDIIDSQVGSKVLACLEELELDWKSEFFMEESRLAIRLSGQSPLRPPPVVRE